MLLLLRHKNEILGKIVEIFTDGAWMTGTFVPEPSAQHYAEFFAFMVNETRSTEDPPFEEDLLNPDNWSIEENGTIRGIEVPAVHSDSSISWRWR